MTDGNSVEAGARTIDRYRRTWSAGSCSLSPTRQGSQRYVFLISRRLAACPAGAAIQGPEVYAAGTLALSG